MGKKKDEAGAAALPPEKLLGRMVGAYLAGVALLATYAAGLACGVDGPTALLRACATAVVFLFAGRFTGWFVGRHLLAERDEPADGAESEPVT